MNGDRLRCRECGRYRSVASKYGEVSMQELTDDAVVMVVQCPTDGCDADTATPAGGT